jgi:hypothetical protein
LDVRGTYDGIATFYEFFVDESTQLGSDINFYTQLNRISILEQNKSFVRGTESYSVDGGKSWFFVCNIYGVISQSLYDDTKWNFKLQEYFNKVNTSNHHDQAETIGELDCVLDTTTNQVQVMYVGQTISKQKFGSQSFIATWKS